jgi:hypothetical protein
MRSASAWGHITVRGSSGGNALMLTTMQIVQLLIERGCQYAARNNEGFTASDYSYSYAWLSLCPLVTLSVLQV